MSNIQIVTSYFPQHIKKIFNKIPFVNYNEIQEIRFRIKRPLSIGLSSGEKFLKINGMLTNYYNEEDILYIDKKEIEETFQSICEYSIYKYANEIEEGYITIKGGNRVGICGTAIYSDEKHIRICDISGLNFRIARQVKNCASYLYSKIFSCSLSGLLVIGPVSSGKTTIIRDLCRILGQTYKISLIDSRNEIAGVLNGIPQNDIGIHTDVYDGFIRSKGSLIALRVMSPQIIVCDEIGTEDDVDALLKIHGCGVCIIATAHALSIEDVYKRKAIKQLIDAGVFKNIALLGTKEKQGEIISIKQVNV